MSPLARAFGVPIQEPGFWGKAEAVARGSKGKYHGAGNSNG